jgi:hypothetical protein
MNNNIALFFVFFVGAAAVIVATAMTFRYKTRELQHRERMAAIERGSTLALAGDASAGGWTPRTYQLRGLMWLFSGIAIAACLFAVSLTAGGETPASIRVADANRAKSDGATDEQVRAIMDDRGRRGLPPGVALIGLIPFGIGLAYLITYRSEISAGRV